jgi:predicted nuclease with TOPRIM domain
MSNISGLAESVATNLSQNSSPNQPAAPKSWNSGHDTLLVSAPPENLAHLAIPSNPIQIEDDADADVDVGGATVSYLRFASLRERAAKGKAEKSFAKWLLGGITGSVVIGAGLVVVAKAGLIGLAFLGGPWTIAAIALVGLAWIGLSAYKGLRAAAKERELWDNDTANRIDDLKSTIQSSEQGAQALRSERDNLQAEVAQLRNKIETKLDGMNVLLTNIQDAGREQNNGVKPRHDELSGLLKNIQVELEQYKDNIKELATKSDSQSEDHGELSGQLNELASKVEGISKEIKTTIGAISEQQHNQQTEMIGKLKSKVQELKSKVQELQSDADKKHGAVDAAMARLSVFSSSGRGRTLSHKTSRTRSTPRSPHNHGNSGQATNASSKGDHLTVSKLGRSSSHSPRAASNGPPTNTASNTKSKSNAKLNANAKPSANMKSSASASAKSNTEPNAKSNTESNASTDTDTNTMPDSNSNSSVTTTGSKPDVSGHTKETS